MELIFGSLQQGLLFGIMAIGVYITFRILNFPDLTVDGSFTLGGATSAALIIAGMNPWMATVVAMVAGALAGTITGILHTKGKINGLLAGILTMIALYSINLRVMGKANLSMLREDTIVSDIKYQSWIGDDRLVQHIVLVIAFLLIVFIVKLLIDWFFHTDLGMALRATGDNARMIRSLGVNTDHTIIIGLALSNGLVALAGALTAQFQGFADVQMGVGMIVIGLATVIIGEVVIGHSTIFRATLGAIGGAIIYRFVVASALYFSILEPNDMKLITAVLVILALVLPRSIEKYKLNKQRQSLQQEGGVIDAYHRTAE